MDFTNSWRVLLFLAIALFGASMATKYEVGDHLGWTAAGNIDYNYWAFDHKSFRIGDKLVFKYDRQFHNVMEVNKEDYESCNSKSPILTYTTGHDSVELKSCGHHYYICGSYGHCEAGQKVDIFVKGENDTCVPIVSPPGHNAAISSTVSLKCLFAAILGIVAYIF